MVGSGMSVRLKLAVAAGFRVSVRVGAGTREYRSDEVAALPYQYTIS